MDRTDIKLISLLQANARTPLKQLAKEVYFSSPATAARIEKLQNDETIVGYTAVINHKKLGYPIIAYINLEMTPSQKPTFYPFIRQCPNVLECSCVTGQYSMLIKVAFESTETLDAFIGKLQTFGNTQTQIVFSTVLEPRCIQIEDLL